MKLRHGVWPEIEEAADELLRRPDNRFGHNDGDYLSAYSLEVRQRREMPVGPDPTFRKGIYYRAANIRQWWLNSCDGPGQTPSRQGSRREEPEPLDVWSLF